MVLPWITVNPRLQSGITLINSVTPVKFQSLLQLIINPTTESAFSTEELEKLQESSTLSTTELKLLIQSVVYIFKQSSKIILKPTTLHKQLVDELKINVDKAEEFVKVWTNTTKSQFENLEDRLKLTNLSCELNVQTASSTSKETLPNARIKMTLSHVTGKVEKENVAIELNEEELLEMYHTLENIQKTLDNIQDSTK